MSERDSYPAGVPCFVETRQADAGAAAAFHRDLFGWETDGPQGVRTCAACAGATSR